MNEPDEKPGSRRAFIKNALVGAAGTLMASSNEYAAGANSVFRQRRQGSNLSQLSLSEASQLVRSKKVSPVELTHECLSRIERFNPKLNAFITITAESALAEARQAEAEIQKGRWKGPLHGIPIALKDLIDTAGLRTTAASAVIKDRIPTEDAEIVRRLKAAGAVFLGKLNMHEYAYGGSSAISYFGPVRNPWNVDYSPGGSSGGSAAAVAAHLCYAAIGTDTGGSIRQPAAYCGIVGLKPTYGRVSTSGVIPLSWSLDHLGPITRTSLDAALILQVIAGYDPQDTGSIDAPVPNYASIIAGSTALRLGIPRAYFYEELDPEIRAATEAALSDLKKLTTSLQDVPPLASDATYSSWMNPYVAVITSEAYAYHKESVAHNPELYQAPTLRRLRVGADVATSTYIQSRRQLDSVRRSSGSFFKKVDLVITPTARVPPFAIADLQADSNTTRAKELAMLHNTRPLNFPGLPTISIPCGFTRAGLPIGMQITGPAGSEATVLRLAYAYEQATEWHRRRPNLD